MKKLKPGKVGLMLLFITALNTVVYGQKAQEGMVRVPQNIKIDGKLNEWGDNLQAYNKTTLVNYTITNDNSFLYLIIKAGDQPTSNKITAGGIGFTVNTTGKKKEQDAFVLTFPMISRDAMSSMFQRRDGQGGGFGGGQGGGFGGGPGGPQPVDSATLAARHKATIAAAKEIKLLGFKDITDSVISVYNEYNIKAAIGYDTRGNLTYELAVPLKSLGLSIENPKEFAFNVKLNGLQMRDRGGDDRGGDRGGNGGGQGGGGGFARGGQGGGGGFARGGQGGFPGGGFGGPPPGMQSMMSPTDFWGKYTLVKN